MRPGAAAVRCAQVEGLAGGASTSTSSLFLEAKESERRAVESAAHVALADGLGKRSFDEMRLGFGMAQLSPAAASARARRVSSVRARHT